MNVESIMSDVIGQNNATVDVPAVQQAVEAGGTVVLHGTFSFVDARLPGPLGSQVILVTRGATIRGQDATILGGGSDAPGGKQAVFFIDAPGGDVTIEGLRFVNPHNAAIRVGRSGDLTIAKCQVMYDSFGRSSHQAMFRMRHSPSIFRRTSRRGLDYRESLSDWGTANDGIGGIVMSGTADRC